MPNYEAFSWIMTIFKKGCKFVFSWSFFQEFNPNSLSHILLLLQIVLIFYLLRVEWKTYFKLMSLVTCRSWGIICLTIAYFWQLYTLWILVQLHEAVPGRRYNRYVELAQAAFGESLFHLSIILLLDNNWCGRCIYVMYQQRMTW